MKTDHPTPLRNKPLPPLKLCADMRIEWLHSFVDVLSVGPDAAPPSQEVASHIAELERRCEAELVDADAMPTVAGLHFRAPVQSLLDAISDFESFGRPHPTLRTAWDTPHVSRWADADVAAVRHDMHDLVTRIESILAHG